MTVDQRAAGLWRSGNEQEAMRVYLEEIRRIGDETIALAKIGRRPKTLRGYRRRFPEFAAEVEKALEYHRDVGTIVDRRM